MEKAFEYRNVIKTFPDFQLGPIDLALHTGTVLGLVGPNGSGKTTTIQCLVGLLRADSGDMQIFGRFNDLHKPEWKLDLGYVGDAHVFYERWSGARNLRFLAQFYPRWSQEKVIRLAERFHLPLDKRVKELSTGNRVKLSLVSALAYSPRLLLLDEPTIGIDPVVRDEIQDALFEIIESGDRAILYTTHTLPEISRLADDIAFIDEGRIWMRAAKEDLIENWRRISFKLKSDVHELKHTVHHLREENDHRIISSNHRETLKQLKEKGAENITETHMSIEDIAVCILKEGRHAKFSDN